MSTDDAAEKDLSRDYEYCVLPVWDDAPEDASGGMSGDDGWVWETPLTDGDGPLPDGLFVGDEWFCELPVWDGEDPDGVWVDGEDDGAAFEDDDDEDDESGVEYDDGDLVLVDDAPSPEDAICWGRGPDFEDDGLAYITAVDDGGASPEEIRTDEGMFPTSRPMPVEMARGGGEDDDMRGGRGDDDLRGRGGDDTMHGRGGADSLEGGRGADALYGDDGRDRLEGGGGDDVLHGGQGRDRLHGGGGDDALYADGGADRMFGGRGEDMFHFNLEDGTGNTIFVGDFESGVDQLVCHGYDRPVTEADFDFVTVRDGLSNVLLFGEVIAAFDTSRGEVPGFDDLLFA